MYSIIDWRELEQKAKEAEEEKLELSPLSVFKFIGGTVLVIAAFYSFILIFM